MACADDKEHATLWEISLLSLSYGNEPLRPSVLASIQNGPSHTQQSTCIALLFGWRCISRKMWKPYPKKKDHSVWKCQKNVSYCASIPIKLTTEKKAQSNYFFENLVIVIFWCFRLSTVEVERGVEIPEVGPSYFSGQDR